jgi:hypothetical protein
MQNEERKLADARAQLVELFQSTEWRIAESARQDARKLGYQTECSMCDFILEKLETGIRIHAVALGEPPGS